MDIKCMNFKFNQSKFMTGKIRRMGRRWGLGEGMGYFNQKIHWKEVGKMEIWRDERYEHGT